MVVQTKQNNCLPLHPCYYLWTYLHVANKPLIAVHHYNPLWDTYFELQVKPLDIVLIVKVMVKHGQWEQGHDLLHNKVVKLSVFGMQICGDLSFSFSATELSDV